MNKQYTESFSLLYAEDDTLIRESYTNYFKTLFKIVYEACDGRDAYKLFIDHRPDILLFDINMPYINGLELIKKIRAIDKKVKIIILTAYLDEEKLLQAIPLGLEAYLQKPVKKKDLQDTLFKVSTELESKHTLSKLWRLSEAVQWDRDKSILTEDNLEVHLTKNELTLMLILSCKSKIHYSIDDILTAFWQYQNEKDMTENSIRNIIKRLKLKLPKESIQNHYGIGYRLNKL
ncbi:response regulator [Sulfurimonas sp.]|nr:response regulator [Sulfurimonas sp.]